MDLNHCSIAFILNFAYAPILMLGTMCYSYGTGKSVLIQNQKCLVIHCCTVLVFNICLP